MSVTVVGWTISAARAERAIWPATWKPRRRRTPSAGSASRRRRPLPSSGETRACAPASRPALMTSRRFNFVTPRWWREYRAARAPWLVPVGRLGIPFPPPREVACGGRRWWWYLVRSLRAAGGADLPGPPSAAVHDSAFTVQEEA